MFIIRWMNKENVVHPFYLFSHEKEWDMVHTNMNEPEKQFSEWMKPKTKGNISHDSS